MNNYQVAQVNIAHLIAPEGDPIVADFFANVPRINLLAESSPGFIWRYEGDYPDPSVAFNLSVWESVESLSEFAYRSAHVDIFRRRNEWFKTMPNNHMALWWVAPGHLPSVEESLEKLKLLDEHGPSEQAFTFKTRFAMPSGN